jgi:undecaprenyl phosphate N,N'-diacetylbacillosamine 1-phosphate transferase
VRGVEMYVKFFKRFFDFIFSLIAVVVLSPVLLALIIVGAVAMRGNPFFVQPRPGKKGKDGQEKIFKLVKFRTMDNRKDKYGKIMRITSLDELPELFNILKGDMSIVGPRPLLVSYLPWYTEEEHHRHDVRPGLTGLAQVNGRNAIKLWESVFAYDLKYVSNITWIGDLKIILSTISKVFKRSDVVVPTGEGGSGRLDVERRNRQNNVTTR